MSRSLHEAEVHAEYGYKHSRRRIVGDSVKSLKNFEANDFLFDLSSTKSTFVNGALHWLVWTAEDDAEKKNRFVLPFDLIDQRCQKIALPLYNFAGIFGLHFEFLAVSSKGSLGFVFLCQAGFGQMRFCMVFLGNEGLRST